MLDAQLAAERPSVSEFFACFARQARRGVPGVATIRRQSFPLAGGDPAPESELERRLDTALRHAGLRLRRQYRVPWFDGRRGLVDFADPDSRTIVEADGLRWHGTRQTMVPPPGSDRAAHGWVVIRVTWDELVQDPGAVANEIRELIEARRRAFAA